MVDLESAAGKICYIFTQKVGTAEKIIGVDFNDEMLELTRNYLDEMEETLGCRNREFVEFKTSP